MQDFLDWIVVMVYVIVDKGEVVSYILEFVCIDFDQFGIVIVIVDGMVCMVGDVDVFFFIQLVLKVFVVVLVLGWVGDQMWWWVGCELFGLVFDFILFLECENGILCNLFINVGVLVVIDMYLVGLLLKVVLVELLCFVWVVVDDDSIYINDVVV